MPLWGLVGTPDGSIHQIAPRQGFSRAAFADVYHLHQFKRVCSLFGLGLYVYVLLLSVSVLYWFQLVCFWYITKKKGGGGGGKDIILCSPWKGERAF
jgi:hypothetical protein